MNFWNRINARWTKEELSPWSSFYKTLYLLFPVVIYYIAGDVIEVVLWALINSVLGHSSENTVAFFATNQATVRGIIYALGLVAGILILSKSAKNEILYEGPDAEIKTMSVLNACILVVVSFCASVGLNYIFDLTGLNRLSESYNEIESAQFGVAFYFGLVIYGIFSPLAEEIIFRGILYNRMKRVFPLYVSMFVSSLLFGIFHGNPVQGIYGTLMGLLIVWSYEHFKNFSAPLIVHSVANVSIFILGNTLWR
ncbi:MAG: CPBP family intramembrane metalloprotease [Lachnospiraceae bacterium]|nr:CPBP family intramembrane metalloprotease [Lachnospiraceae bacterium]